MSESVIMLSAGGTGGHLFPAEALAGELLRRGHRVVIVTDKRGHAFKSLGDRAVIHTVRAATLKAGIVPKVKAVIDMGLGIVQAALLIRKYRPGVIAGFGGYPSFPAMFAGQMLGVPTVLHEQNAVLGKANHVLAARARAIATSLPETRGISVVNHPKTVLTGIPLRAPVVALHERGYVQPGDEVRILITGGSQAASVFGEIVPPAVALLPEPMKKRLFLMHQAREKDVASTAEKYRAAGIRAEVMPFFTDMAARLASSHLFIGRSGASSVAEAAMAGLPAIFVPLRHADMQQKHNALSVTEHGGGWLMMQEDFTPKALAEKLQELLEKPELLADAALKARACARPDAAALLCDLVEKVNHG